MSTKPSVSLTVLAPCRRQKPRWQARTGVLSLDARNEAVTLPQWHWPVWTWGSLTPSSSLVGHGLDRLDDLLDRRQRQGFEVGGIRHGHVLAVDAGRRRIEIVECLAHDDGGDFGADAHRAPALLHRDQAVGLPARGQDRVLVQGAQGAQVA